MGSSGQASSVQSSGQITGLHVEFGQVYLSSPLQIAISVTSALPRVSVAKPRIPLLRRAWKGVPEPFSRAGGFFFKMEQVRVVVGWAD